MDRRFGVTVTWRGWRRPRGGGPGGGPGGVRVIAARDSTADLWQGRARSGLLSTFAGLAAAEVVAGLVRGSVVAGRCRSGRRSSTRVAALGQGLGDRDVRHGRQGGARPRHAVLAGRDRVDRRDPRRARARIAAAYTVDRCRRADRRLAPCSNARRRHSASCCRRSSARSTSIGGALVAERATRTAARLADERRPSSTTASSEPARQQRWVSVGAASCRRRSTVGCSRRWSPPGSGGCCSAASTSTTSAPSWRSRQPSDRRPRRPARCARARRPATTDFGIDGITPWSCRTPTSTGSTRRSPCRRCPKDSWSLQDPRHGRPRDRADLRRPACSGRGSSATSRCRACRTRSAAISSATPSGQGVRFKDVLDEAGVQAGRRRSWSAARSTAGRCGTPIAVIMDGRDAMLAIAMNGEPLPRRARLPGAAGRAGPVRLRVGDEVGHRDRAHHAGRTSTATGSRGAGPRRGRSRRWRGSTARVGNSRTSPTPAA